MNYINTFLFVLFFSLFCKARLDSEETANAKWYYYAYAMGQKIYIDSGNEINPLSCNIKLNAKEHYNGDTVRYYFSLYRKDSLDICYLKPLGLVGVLSIRNKLYTPIYHSIIFDNVTDSSISKEMKEKNAALLQKVLRSGEAVSPWLRVEAARRNAN